MRQTDHPNIVEHYENPRNVGSLNKDAKNVGTGLVGAPACGDVMKLQIRVGEDGRIEDAKFKTFGCGSAIASSSVATEWVKGRTVEECLAIKNTDIAAHLKLPPVKLHCRCALGCRISFSFCFPRAFDSCKPPLLSHMFFAPQHARGRCHQSRAEGLAAKAGRRGAN